MCVFSIIPTFFFLPDSNLRDFLLSGFLCLRLLWEQLATEWADQYAPDSSLPFFNLLSFTSKLVWLEQLLALNGFVFLPSGVWVQALYTHQGDCLCWLYCDSWAFKAGPQSSPWFILPSIAASSLSCPELSPMSSINLLTLTLHWVTMRYFFCYMKEINSKPNLTISFVVVFFLLWERVSC